VLAIAARAIEQRLNADTSDYGGSEQLCACGGTARYVERRQKRFITAVGELLLARAYYHCAACGQGFCPRDQALGMQAQSLSPAVLRMIGSVGALVSFEQGSELLRELAGVRVDAKRVERGAEALGSEVADDEQHHVQVATEAEVAATMYLGMDGTGVPMRASELAGRAGKQPDGTAKTREVKLCAIWSAEGRDASGMAVRDPGSVSYNAAIESVATSDTGSRLSPFAKRVGREARRRGFERAKRRVVVGDGAPWIWKLTEEMFPGAIQIVDRFHVKQHLSEVAKAIYGTPSELGREWAKQRHAELDAGDIDAIQQALKAHVKKVPEARRCRDYLDNNRQRMRYPQFHAQGLCTSSGVLEAGCRVAIGQRLKQSGMLWSEHGANAIIALRCTKLSGRFEDFWERRAERGRPAA
jgi:uncharacterized protein UPF0236